MSTDQSKPLTRTLTSHIVNPANDKIEITVIDEPGSGGANHAYLVEGMDMSGNPAAVSFAEVDAERTDERYGLCIAFQNGPIAANGVNGVTQEVLLAIVEDRLKSFQAGPYACRENAVALAKIQEAMMWLQRRTLERMRRGVEGTHQK
jgi:hypothetical protein